MKRKGTKGNGIAVQNSAVTTIFYEIVKQRIKRTFTNRSMQWFVPDIIPPGKFDFVAHYRL